MSDNSKESAVQYAIISPLNCSPIYTRLKITETNFFINRNIETSHEIEKVIKIQIQKNYKSSVSKRRQSDNSKEDIADQIIQKNRKFTKNSKFQYLNYY